MHRSTGVLVVGAGIGGLTAALAFAKAGFSVEIFERAPKLEEAGAGLQLSPNALRVLARLNLRTSDLNGVVADSVTLRTGSSGRIIAAVPVVASDGTAYLSLHRADLQAALLAAVTRQPLVTLTLNAVCTGLRSDATGTTLSFRSAAKSAFERRATVVIAADGVNSMIAQNLGRPLAQASGDVAWRMTVTHAASDLSPRAGIEAWLGPARHAVAYPVRRGRETNLVLIGRSGDVASDRKDTATKDQLLARFAGWDPRLRALIATAGPAAAWPLSTRPPAGNAADPPGLFLIGDAAHAMLPYAAQGAAMAIEDAWVAAQCVTIAPTLDEARRRYAAQRDPRVAKVLARVAFHRRVYHLPFPFVLARDLVLRSRSKATLARDLAWLYDWVPPEL